jgi:hypothetical protein
MRGIRLPGKLMANFSSDSQSGVQSAPAQGDEWWRFEGVDELLIMQ